MTSSSDISPPAAEDPVAAKVEVPSRTRPWAEAWYAWSSAAVLRAYLDSARGAPFVPSDRAELALTLDTLLLEAALRELGTHLRRRDGRVAVPLRALAEMVAR